MATGRRRYDEVPLRQANRMYEVVSLHLTWRSCLRTGADGSAERARPREAGRRWGLRAVVERPDDPGRRVGAGAEGSQIRREERIGSSSVLAPFRQPEGAEAIGSAPSKSWRDRAKRRSASSGSMLANSVARAGTRIRPRRRPRRLRPGRCAMIEANTGMRRSGVDRSAVIVPAVPQHKRQRRGNETEADFERGRRPKESESEKAGECGEGQEVQVVREHKRSQRVEGLRSLGRDCNAFQKVKIETNAPIASDASASRRLGASPKRLFPISATAAVRTKKMHHAPRRCTHARANRLGASQQEDGRLFESSARRAIAEGARAPREPGGAPGLGLNDEQTGKQISGQYGRRKAASGDRRRGEEKPTLLTLQAPSRLASAWPSQPVRRPTCRCSMTMGRVLDRALCRHSTSIGMNRRLAKGSLKAAAARKAATAAMATDRQRRSSHPLNRNKTPTPARAMIGCNAAAIVSKAIALPSFPLSRLARANRTKASAKGRGMARGSATKMLKGEYWLRTSMGKRREAISGCRLPKPTPSSRER